MACTWSWKDYHRQSQPRKEKSVRAQTEPMATVAARLRTLNEKQLRVVALEAEVKIGTLRDWVAGYVANGRADTVYRVQTALNLDKNEALKRFRKAYPHIATL